MVALPLAMPAAIAPVLVSYGHILKPRLKPLHAQARPPLNDAEGAINQESTQQHPWNRDVLLR
jgi:hypothetical protein